MKLHAVSIPRAAPWALILALGLLIAATATGSAAPIPDVEWERIAIGGSAPDRALHSMIFDPVNELMWVFGGIEADAQSNQFRNLVYKLDVTDPDARWQRVPLGGLQPRPLAFHTATYDPLRHRMIVYGGLVDRTRYSEQQPAEGNIVWYLDLADPEKPAWSREVVPGNPVDRFAHAAVYVPEHDALVVSGGSETFSRATGSNYALLLGEEPKRWVRLANAGFSLRAAHALAYDAAGQRLLVYGGLADFNNIVTFGDIVQLDLSQGLTDSKAWTRVSTARPGIPRAFMATVFDPATRLWWVSGGLQNDNSFLRDLSVLDLNPSRPEWTQTRVVYNGPLDRFAHVAAMDPARNRIIFQGGTPDNNITMSDTRSLNFMLAETPTPTATGTTAPPTVTPTGSPTPTSTVGPSATATEGLTMTPTGSPTVTATVESTATATATPTGTGTREPTTTTTPGDVPDLYLPIAYLGEVP
jgi:hypothetical protein